MNKKNLIIGGVVLAVAGIAYYLYTRKKPEAVEPINKIQKNACGQTIPTVIPCVKNLDNDGKCYDSKGIAVDINKIPMGQPCFNKNGTSRDVRNIAV
jgi:hypothetical protein